MKTGIKSYNKGKIVLTSVMAALTIAVIVISTVMLATSVRLYSNFNSKINDYLFVIGLSFVFMVEMLLLIIVEKAFNINISPAISLAYVIHCFGGTYLGNVANVYYIIPEFDKYMHFLVGLNLGMMGLAAIQHFNRNQDCGVNPLFAAFAVLFAGIALSTLWEIFEFTADTLFDLNMQSYAQKTGEMYVGRAALMNTMVDIVANTAGAAVVAILTYFSYKHKKNWHLLCRISKKPKKETAINE